MRSIKWMQLVASGFMLCVIFPAFAGTNYTWTGAGTTNSWANTANWSPAGVPGTDPTDNVSFGKVVGFSPKLDQNRTIGNMAMSHQVLDLNGFALTVNGTTNNVSFSLIKNGAISIAPTAVADNSIIQATNTSYLAFNTTQIATTFAYFVRWTDNELAYTGGPSGEIQYAHPILPVSGTFAVNLVIQDPATPGVSKSIELTVNSTNQITAVKVLGGTENYVLPPTYYALYNDKSYIEFAANLLPLLFKSCDVAGTENLNFVRTQYLQVPCTDPNTINSLPVESVLQTTAYMDGLGRTLQIVGKQISPAKKDIVKIFEYDVNGNAAKDYLAYASDLCNGSFIDPVLAKTQQKNFYTVNSDPLIPKVVAPSMYTGTQNTTYYETVYDKSPLHRALESAGPGEAWKVVGEPSSEFFPPVTNSYFTGKTKKYGYKANVADEVLLWTYSHATGNASAFNGSVPVYYPVNTLTVLEATNEDGGKVTQFVDKSGKLLLKRELKEVGTNMDTYYIYDDFGRLVYIVPPQATSQLFNFNYQITSSSSLTLSYLFVYQYDERHRVVSSKIPGADAKSIVYDQLDRPVMTQDGNQAISKEWMFLKYDIVGRPILSGRYTYTDAPTNTRTVWQNSFNATSVLYEKRTSVAGSIEGYSNTVLPTSITATSLYTVNYYDDYDYASNGAPDFYYTPAGLGPQEPTGIDYNPRGRATGGKVRALDGATNPWLWTIGFYDAKGRMVQAQANNHLYLSVNPSSSSTLDVTTVVYDFADKVTKVKQIHTPAVSSTVTVTKDLLYDHVGRLQSISQQNNNEPAVTIAKYNRNELGQLTERNLHSENNGTTFLQSVDYRHNIRGWLTNINNTSLGNDGLTNNDANDLFGMELVYESNFNGLNVPKYDGSISAMKWKTNNAAMGTSIERAYTYQYNLADQLLRADYADKSSGTWQSSNKYKESGITYDLNGNIKSLTRRNETGGIMDSLVYFYSGNQIQAMTDNGIASAGFIKTSTAATQYVYDKNGNLTTDLNKEVTLTYNYFNQIKTVTGTGSKAGKTIAYTYDAQGKKLKKSVTSGGVTTVTHYVDGFVYQYTASTYSLQFFATEEGRVVPNGSGGFNFQYTLTDHLGSARITFDKGQDGKARILQEDHYYGFGMRMGGLSYSAGSPRNPFLYGKNEVEDDYNLLNQYDYGFRQYDPVLGRWHSPDLLSGMYHNFSPYHYSGNNPINNMDLHGLGFIDKVKDFFKNAFGGGKDGGNPCSNEKNAQEYKKNTDKAEASLTNNKQGKEDNGPYYSPEMGSSPTDAGVESSSQQLGGNRGGQLNNSSQPANGGGQLNDNPVTDVMSFIRGNETLNKEYNELVEKYGFTLYSDGTAPEGSTLVGDQFQVPEKGGTVLTNALTYRTNVNTRTGASNPMMYLSPGALKTGQRRLYVTLRHEFQHARDWGSGAWVNFTPINKTMELRAYKISIEAADEMGLQMYDVIPARYLEMIIRGK